MIQSPTRYLPGLLVLALALVPASAEAAGGAAAEYVFGPEWFPVSNSMVTSWVISLLIIIGVRAAVGRPQMIPTRGQSVVESMATGIRDVVAPIVGKKVVHAAFPLLIGLFIYILIHNWSGLIPGVGTIFTGGDSHGHWTPLVRPANADMNGTVALAFVSFFAWIYLILRYAGPKVILHDIFGNKADKREIPAAIYYFLFVIFFAVGIIELISIAFRPVSLSFRLFGNVFGGENLLHSMSAIVQWGLPIPFYFLEVLIGFVQAFVFTLLVSVYIGLICNHGDDHEQDEAHDHGSASPAPVAH
jgi:F-type H+-transporting ATPase subunit a